jgi:DNA-binding NarL/FixJ family response regulator
MVAVGAFQQIVPKPRIVVAENEPVLIQGITSTLTSDYEIVGTATDGEALVEAAREEQPDLIILAISLSKLDGFQAAVRIKEFLPEVRLLFFTIYDTPAYVGAAIRAGASGYILKSSTPDELLRAVKQVLAGEQYIAVGASAGTHAEREPTAPAERGRVITPGLTTRETEVLRYIAQGLSAKEIAFLLTISVRTVGFHRDKLKKKLGLSSTAELTKCAIDLGLA